MNRRSPLQRWTLGDPHGPRSAQHSRSAGRPSEAVAGHFGDDRLDRRARPAHGAGALREGAMGELGKTRPDVRGPTADLATYTDPLNLRDDYPDRFHQMSIVGQRLMPAAAGLAREGFVRFLTTYAAFASRRTFDSSSMASPGKAAGEDPPRAARPHLRLWAEPPGD
jgi:hypothetical protein